MQIQKQMKRNKERMVVFIAIISIARPSENRDKTEMKELNRIPIRNLSWMIYVPISIMILRLVL